MTKESEKEARRRWEIYSEALLPRERRVTVVGEAQEREDGSLSIRLDAIPVGFDGVLSASLVEEKAGGSTGLATY